MYWQAPSYSQSAYQQPSLGVQQQPVHPSEGESSWPERGGSVSPIFSSPGEAGWPERGVGSPIYSPPISSSLLQDDWEGKLMVSNILCIENYQKLRDSASSFHWLSSSIFSYCLAGRLSRIGNIPSHLHYMMFLSIQTIYFL